VQEQARKECALQCVDRSCDWQALTCTQPGTAPGRLDAVSSSHPRYVYVISGLKGGATRRPRCSKRLCLTELKGAHRRMTE
jgi:hypothetical protein